MGEARKHISTMRSSHHLMQHTQEQERHPDTCSESTKVWLCRITFKKMLFKCLFQKYAGCLCGTNGTKVFILMDALGSIPLHSYDPSVL